MAPLILKRASASRPVWPMDTKEAPPLSGAAMTERLKLRHKVTGEEKGPYWSLLNANSWMKLFSTGEYDYIRSSDCYDKHGNEIFEGDMVSYMDGWPVHIVDVIGRVGYFEDGKLSM